MQYVFLLGYYEQNAGSFGVDKCMQVSGVSAVSMHQDNAQVIDFTLTFI